MTNRSNKAEVIVLSDETVALDKPKSSFELAHSLKEVIVKNHLYSNIRGKNYVNVEGWQIAGELVGVFPRMKSVERVDTKDPNEVKYRAEVALFQLKDGKTVGYGVALCSNQESSKRKFDEYAIASMAQTRAVGKAYRLMLGWLMKLAGYEATPSDEMSASEEAEQAPDLKPAPGTTEEKIASVQKSFTQPVETPEEHWAASPKQLIWLKTAYIRYEGLPLEKADTKAKSFKGRDELHVEIARVAEVIKAAEAKSE